MLEEALEHLVKGIVDHKDDVVRSAARTCAAVSCSRSGCTPTTSAASSAAPAARRARCAPSIGALAGGQPGPHRHRRHRPGPLTPTSTDGGVCREETPRHTAAVCRPTAPVHDRIVPVRPERRRRRRRPDRQAARAARRGDRPAAHRRARAPLRRRHGHRRPRPTAGTGVPRALTIGRPGSTTASGCSAFEEIPDRTGAESLRGTRLVVDAADVLPAADEDDVFTEERAARPRRRRPRGHGARRR